MRVQGSFSRMLIEDDLLILLDTIDNAEVLGGQLSLEVFERRDSEIISEVKRQISEDSPILKGDYSEDDN